MWPILSLSFDYYYATWFSAYLRLNNCVVVSSEHSNMQHEYRPPREIIIVTLFVTHSMKIEFIALYTWKLNLWICIHVIYGGMVPSAIGCRPSFSLCIFNVTYANTGHNMLWFHFLLTSKCFCYLHNLFTISYSLCSNTYGHVILAISLY